MKRLTDRILNLMGVAILLIAVLIGAGVLMNVFGISRLVNFDEAIWLIGDRITFNTLKGLQTLLFTFAVMITVSVAWYLDRQVRVDFFYQTFSVRIKALINFLGTAFLALPFLVMALPPSWRFLERSWRIGESSTDGGLAEIYILKALLPLGLLLLLMVACYWLIASALILLRGEKSDV